MAGCFIINPRNTIQQIASATKMNDLEIRRIVYSLLQAGLVETIRIEGAPMSSSYGAGLSLWKIKKSKNRWSIASLIRIRSL